MSSCDKTDESSNEMLGKSSEVKHHALADGNNKNQSFDTIVPFPIKEEPAVSNPVRINVMSTVPVSEVKLKIKKVKLRNRELGKKILCQETELSAYKQRLSKYSEDIVNLKNEIISLNKSLEVSKEIKCILQVEISKRETELKKFKEDVQKYVKDENEFINMSKMFENEKRKLKKTEKELHRTIKLIETRTSTIKNIKEQMKKIRSILLQFGRILNENDNKLSSKHKKYLKTVEDEYLKDSYSDEESFDIKLKMEVDDDFGDLEYRESWNKQLSPGLSGKCYQEVLSTDKDNNNKSIKDQYNKLPICNTSKISNSSYTSTSEAKNNLIPNKEETSNNSEVIHTNSENGILNSPMQFYNTAFSPRSFFISKNLESVTNVISTTTNVLSSNTGATNILSCNDEFNNVSSDTTTLSYLAESSTKQKANDCCMLIDVKEEPVSSDSESEFFQPTVSASEVALRIQRLKFENQKLKAKNTSQENELHNFELKLSNRLTQLFDIMSERNNVKELLDIAEEEKSRLEINLGEKDAELKQFKELVQKYMRFENDAITMSKKLNDSKKYIENIEKELLHATNILKMKTASLKKIRGRRRKARNTILHFGKVLKERGIKITSKQKQYLKAIEDMHLIDCADKEIVVPKIENVGDFSKDMAQSGSQIVDVSSIKQENISET